MNTVNLSEGKLAYRQIGEGRPVVLLHGYCGSHRYWDDVAPLLSGQYRIITPDLRGHGLSSAGEGTYGMERLADDIVVLLDELRLEKVRLFGHSLGGYVALALAERWPDRLEALGLVHSTSLPDGEPAKENRLKAAEAITTDGIVPFVDGLVPKLFAPAHRELMGDKVARAKEIGYETAVQGAIGCALGMRERPDRTFVLERLGVPVLLLAGEHDEVIPPERRFPVSGTNISRVTLGGAGHMGMMESPQDFAEAVISFIEGNG